MWLLSVEVSTASGIGAQNEGQPEPLSYLVEESNSGSPQPAQRKTPARFSSFSGLVKGRSVPWSRNTWCCSGSRSLRHSASLFWMGVLLLMMSSDVAIIGAQTRVRNSDVATESIA